MKFGQTETQSLTGYMGQSMYNNKIWGHVISPVTETERPKMPEKIDLELENHIQKALPETGSMVAATENMVNAADAQKIGGLPTIFQPRTPKAEAAKNLELLKGCEQTYAIVASEIGLSNNNTPAFRN